MQIYSRTIPGILSTVQVSNCKREYSRTGKGAGGEEKMIEGWNIL